jgi:hypothetical protein
MSTEPIAQTGTTSEIGWYKYHYEVCRLLVETEIADLFAAMTFLASTEHTDVFTITVKGECGDEQKFYFQELKMSDSEGVKRIVITRD